MKIESNRVVSIDYTLRNRKGEVLDASGAGNPLLYIHGIGGLIKGLEEELEGKETGFKTQLTIPPEKAYGEHMPQLIQTLPKSSFQGVDELELGMEFQASGADGSVMVVRIDEIEGDQITVNGNHPLAGKTLDFEVEVMDVREATAEELEHGHVHGEGGHHH